MFRTRETGWFRGRVAGTRYRAPAPSEPDKPVFRASRLKQARTEHALYRTCAGRSSLFRATPRQGPTEQAHRSKARHTAGRRFGSQPRRTSPDATSTAAPSSGGLYKAGQRAVIRISPHRWLRGRLRPSGKLARLHIYASAPLIQMSGSAADRARGRPGRVSAFPRKRIHMARAARCNSVTAICWLPHALTGHDDLDDASSGQRGEPHGTPCSTCGGTR